MTAFTGHNGGVSVGANVVAEVKSFSVEETAEPLDATAMGDSTREFLSPNLTQWSGQLEAHYDPGDTNGQGALTVGTTVSLTLFPVQNSTGNEQLAGSAIITSVGQASAVNEVVSRTIQFQGSGVLTRSTIS